MPRSVEFECARCGMLLGAVIRPSGSLEEAAAIRWVIRNLSTWCRGCRRIVYLDAVETEYVEVPSCMSDYEKEGR